MKIVLELRGKIYCLEISGLVCDSPAEDPRQEVSVGGTETGIAETEFRTFGFSRDIQG